MGEESRRRSKMTKKRKRNQPPTGPSTSVNDLSDDLLEAVLLGLDSPVCLLRVASTCTRWRHVVAGAAFLRRFRSLHPPRPIGHFYNINRYPTCTFGRFHMWPEEAPVYVPISDWIDWRQLSLDFVPCEGRPREIVDSRGSLLLFLKEEVGTSLPERDCHCCAHVADNIVPDLVICEPLTRRYQQIDPPQERVCILSAFLLDGDDDEDDKAGGTISMTNFRVLLVLYHHDSNSSTGDGYSGHGHMSASVYTCGGSNAGWYHGEYSDNVYLPHSADVQFAGRTGGRIYWGCYGIQVLVLDEHTLEFSTMALPDHLMWNFSAQNFRVVTGEGGAVRIVCVTDDGDLEVFSQVHGRSGDDWVLENSVGLAEATRGLRKRKEGYFIKPAKIIRAGEWYAVLSPVEKTWLFYVDLDTIELKRMPRRNRYTGPAFPCMPPWPPFMLSCLNKGRKERKRKASI